MSSWTTRDYGRVHWLTKYEIDPDFVGTYTEFQVSATQDFMGPALQIGPYSLGVVDVTTLKIIMENFLDKVLPEVEASK